jgi:hypothetical protein
VNWRRALPSLAIAVALTAACDGGSAASPSPTGAAVGSIPVGSPAGTSSSQAPGGPSATPTAPLLRLALEGTTPIVGSAAGPIGHPYVLPAAAARDADGGYVLFIVWFGPEPGEQIVTVSRSEDGRDWSIGKEAVFTDLGMDVENPGPIPAAVLQAEDGTWQMFGWAQQASNDRLFSSWRASAPEPEGPWKLEDPAMLTPGATGTWDSQTSSVGTVQRTADGYLAWYEGQPPGRSIRGDIGLATSADGIAWRKSDDATTTDRLHADSDPVIARGICGSGSELAVFQVQVERMGDGFAGIVGAFREGRDEMDIYGVVSDDGLTWRCGGETPLLRFEDIPGSQGIHTIASMPLDDGTFALILESLREGRSELWFATVEAADS